VKAILPISSTIHGKTGLLQTFFYERRNFLIILYHEQSHTYFSQLQ
jgi:hypothetical protein